jgi:hypothetical protein
MARIVKTIRSYIPFNPMNVTLAGTTRIVFELYSVADLVEELLGPFFRIREIHRVA